MATRYQMDARYSRVAMWLHWLIVIAILYNLASGLARPLLPRSFFFWHVSSGITILVLTAVRVIWRLTHKPPPFLPMKAWEATLAHIVHFLLYCGMVLLPLSGWLMVSANPPIGSPGADYVLAKATEKAVAAGKPAPQPRRPTMVWSVIKLPMIGPVNEIGRQPEGVAEQTELHETLEKAHLIGGWLLFLLLILHIGGALKHQFVDRLPELRRMGLGHPGRKRISPAE
jgi:cytochrome b561